MTLGQLLTLYFLMGLAVAFLIHRRAEKGAELMHAVLAVPLWPLWGPLALMPKPVKREIRDHSGAVARIEAALQEGVQLASSSALETLLSADAGRSIIEQAVRADARLTELTQLLSQSELSLSAAKQRVASLETAGTEARALSTARLHLANVERLTALAEADRRALSELEDLTLALRTQLLLVRYAGSSAEGIGGIVSDLWACVEGLGEAMDLGHEAGALGTHSRGR